MTNQLKDSLLQATLLTPAADLALPPALEQSTLDQTGTQVMATVDGSSLPVDQVRGNVSRQDISFFHVDDQPEIRSKTSEGLLTEMEVQIKLGEASSVPEAIGKLESLAQEGRVPHVIILDQRFFVGEGDNVPSAYASESFLGGFVALAARYPILQGVSIVMYSGTADEDYLREMQSICPQVIGLAEKGQLGLPMQLAAILGDAGKVKIDPVITKAQEGMALHRASKAEVE